MATMLLIRSQKMLPGLGLHLQLTFVLLLSLMSSSAQSPNGLGLLA
jgi:hypothetical protein